MPPYTLHLGDNLAALRAMPGSSVDSIVTDPPYGLKFMGKKWDYDVPSVELWQECLRVLKPGGHLLAFAGTRTQHRMAVRIEDAGFEIRDMIAWVYSTGFPKSHNFGCKCSRGAIPCTHEKTISRESPTKRNLHALRNSDVPSSVDSGEGRGEVLQPCLQEQSSPSEGREQFSATEVWSGQSSMEGRSDVLEETRQLQANQIRAVPEGVLADGSQRRVCDGASLDNGSSDRQMLNQNGSGASCEPRPARQPTAKPRAIPKQRCTQERGMAENQTCSKCGGLIEWQGWGTALKPALEPITVARKPLVGTVAENVLEHGTGALNIDGCRVAGWKPQVTQGINSNASSYNVAKERRISGDSNEGRWPANLIHDGSDEVLAGFPVTGPSSGAPRVNKASASIGTFGTSDRVTAGVADAGGSAARFFYCAKASKKDRDEGNFHATVKPTDLMRYLCRLVTPPGGVVLDPFMGSGSTGKAAMLEGFRFIGCELSEEYFKIADARISAALASQPLL